MTASEDTKFKATGHVYDGIQEYDNPLPGWWYWLFIATIVLAPCYMAYYHVGAPGRTLAEKFQMANSENMRKQYAEIGDLSPDEATMLAYMNKEQWMRVGESIFKTHCVSCHGADGGGNNGPNLCDDNYKNVKQVTDIINVVNNGLAGGSMPAWATRLGHKNDIILVSAYVASLRGTTPKAPKAPDGSVIPPWPPAPAAAPVPSTSKDSPKS